MHRARLDSTHRTLIGMDSFSRHWIILRRVYKTASCEFIEHDTQEEQGHWVRMSAS